MSKRYPVLFLLSLRDRYLGCCTEKNNIALYLRFECECGNIASAQIYSDNMQATVSKANASQSSGLKFTHVEESRHLLLEKILEKALISNLENLEEIQRGWSFLFLYVFIYVNFLQEIFLEYYMKIIYFLLLHDFWQSSCGSLGNLSCRTFSTFTGPTRFLLASAATDHKVSTTYGALPSMFDMRVSHRSLIFSPLLLHRLCRPEYLRKRIRHRLVYSRLSYVAVLSS